jgi:hypothetical protein
VGAPAFARDSDNMAKTLSAHTTRSVQTKTLRERNDARMTRIVILPMDIPA